MKKILPFILIVITTPVFSQWSGGIKAGMNLANFTGDDADGSDMRIGYHVGGYAVRNITDNISFLPELLINSVGSKYKESGSDPDFGDYKIEGAFHLTYLSLPLMFAFNLSDNFSLQAGPQVSVMADAKIKYDIESDFINTSGSEDARDQFKTIDFGLNFGVGLDFGKINAAARYCLGLAEIPEESANVKNGVIQFSLGYKIEKK